MKSLNAPPRFLTYAVSQAIKHPIPASCPFGAGLCILGRPRLCHRRLLDGTLSGQTGLEDVDARRLSYELEQSGLRNRAVARVLVQVLDRRC